MAREFWEIFLPDNIIVVGARWDGKNGTAEVTFMYAEESRRTFKAKFVKNSNSINSDWHLSEICDGSN